MAKLNNFEGVDKVARYTKDNELYMQYKKTDVIANSRYDYNFCGNDGLRDQNRAILHIDSRMRRNNEVAGFYTVPLPKEYMSVVSIELLKVDIPNSNYIINEYNNCFYFQDNRAQLETSCNRPYHKIILPVGDYLADSSDAGVLTIRSLLETALNAVNAGNVYEVSVDKYTNLFTIEQVSGSGIFNILFQEPQCNGAETVSYNYNARPLKNCIGTVLGFKVAANKTGNLIYTGEYKYNLYPNRYLVLKINDYAKEYGRMDSNNDVAQNAFAVLGLDTRSNNFNKKDDCDYLDREEYTQYFNPPLTKINKFTVGLYDCNGNIYDFRGSDHFLVFEINSLTRASEYNKKAC